VSFPFSTISLGLFSVVVGTFFLVAIPVIVMSYLLMTIAVGRAVLGLGRRLIFGDDQNSKPQRTSKPSLLKKHLEPQGTNVGLWDRWIDV